MKKDKGPAKNRTEASALETESLDKVTGGFRSPYGPRKPLQPKAEMEEHATAATDIQEKL